MSLSSTLLTGYQIAELKSSTRWRLILLFIQLMATMPIAMSVFVDGEIPLYWLAALSAGMLVLWWFFGSIYAKTREASQSARRANLIFNGLGLDFSASEWQDLEEKFTISPTNAEFESVPTYYASQRAPSPSRLAEILEESAFFTASIQRSSAKIMQIFIVLFFTIAVALSLSLIPSASQSALMLTVRVILACGIFILSSDVFGALRGHLSTAETCDRIRRRLVTAAALKFPQSDVLLAMSDYISVLAIAPEPLPLLFASQREHLDQRWSAYVADRQTRNTNI